MHTLSWVHHTTTLHIIEEQLVTETTLTLLSQHGHGLGHGHNQRASPLPWRGERDALQTEIIAPAVSRHQLKHLLLTIDWLFLRCVAGEGGASVPTRHLASMDSTLTHLCACKTILLHVAIT